MIDRIARAIAERFLRRIGTGQLVVVEDGNRKVYGSGPPVATVHVRSPRVWRKLLRGSRGLAESYFEELWDSPDATAVIRLGARNAGGIDRFRRRLAPLRAPFQRVAGLLVRTQTRRRAKRSIAAHYDLGNELFE
ncbi:MAG: cyclopropane-fatty-acyl-phospholipid synthase, partial [Thermoleophilaceae bacterium]|nr:cyclopropane-fatty-acyl-phospholipid synthase [Thermoleophilaceae bacterium]